jgi:glycosyltransferase involved in cell wall biosynthesis
MSSNHAQNETIPGFGEVDLLEKNASREFVSVIIPCYNEERFIYQALDKLADQYDTSRYEIIVVDGLSEDKSRNLVEKFKQQRPDISTILIENPARNIPSALNLGISAARGEIIARMDAHASPSSGYIRRCVEVLREGKAAVVGMPCRIQPGAKTAIAKAIASAVSNPFGIGDAKYRLQEGVLPQEPVDTVAFACFRKSLWRDISGFNETLLTNEDYDFNYRVRLSGGEVVLDRSEYCNYFARTTIKDLAKQYSRYGGWKARMLILHPRSIKARHLVAPLFVISIVLLTVLGFAWRFVFLFLAAELILYFVLALLFGSRVIKQNSNGILIWLLMPVIFAVIHVSWGFTFLLGLIKRPN